MMTVASLTNEAVAAEITVNVLSALGDMFARWRRRLLGALWVFCVTKKEPKGRKHGRTTPATTSIIRANRPSMHRIGSCCRSCFFLFSDRTIRSGRREGSPNKNDNPLLYFLASSYICTPSHARTPVHIGSQIVFTSPLRSWLYALPSPPACLGSSPATFPSPFPL